MVLGFRFVVVGLYSERHPDQVLIDAALRRQPIAVRELVGRLTPVIQARVAHLLARSGVGRVRDIRQEVADLTQEVFVALFANQAAALRAWKPDAGANLESFVSLIAERHVITHLRSRRKSPLQHESHDPAEFDTADAKQGRADASLVAKAEVMRIADVLRSRLSPQGFEMFYGLFVLEDSVAELSARTGQTADAVYQWRSRIRKQILSIAAESGVMAAEGYDVENDRDIGGLAPSNMRRPE